MKKGKRKDLVFGQSASGKTTWCVALARYLAEKTGKKTRWYLGDGGGETLRVSGVDDFVEVVNYTMWAHPLQITARMCEGWWPADPADPKSKWLPPTADLGKTFGMFVFEGTTVMSDYIMSNKEGGLAYRMGHGQSLNADESFKIQEGDLKLGGNARTHYGFTQRRMLELIELTDSLPGITYWTGHERRAEDDEYKQVLFGPDICGSALTSRIGAWFGNTIHLVAVPQKVKKEDPVTKRPVEQITMEYRAYTRKHHDPEGTNFVRFYANTRLPERVSKERPDLMPEFISPADPIQYYALLEQATRLEQELQARAVAAAPTVDSLVQV